jgi:glycosyltransferase involved in cell wall biosynthesis
VLLPTYKRLDTLQRTLQGLESQDVDNDLYEIVVIDDGSKDGTADFLQEFATGTENRFYAASLAENGGPARARNAGLAVCRGRVILIIGDDIQPDPALLAKHLSFHRTHPDEGFSLLGHVDFPEEMQPNGFMRWLEHGGRKYFFNYADLTSGQTATPLFFYTCNVSVKASLLEKSGWFDESFRYASHEDLELGYRLADVGMQLVYDDTARGSHWHMLSVQGIARRVYLMGYSAVGFWQKVDDRGGWLKRGLRRLLAWASATPPSAALWNHLRQKSYQDSREYPIQWHFLLGLGFFIGLSDGWKNRAPRV